jgi:hypothetical protein
MLIRALSIWLVLLLVAIGNGALRVAWLIPWFGEYWGHVASTVTLCAAIVAVAWTTMGWVQPASAGDALLIGGLWLALTVSFEFLGGHFLFGQPWERLAADYDLRAGRVWVLVLVTTALAPLLAFASRRMPA